MNSEMKFEKNGLLIPNGALEELGLSGISLSAWLGQDHILLMPQEMTALQLLHALEGLSRASVELLGVLQAACRMPCAADCEKDMEDVPHFDGLQQSLVMDTSHKVLRRRQFHFLDGKGNWPGLPAGVDDLVGSDAVEPSTEYLQFLFNVERCTF